MSSSPNPVLILLAIGTAFLGAAEGGHATGLKPLTVAESAAIERLAPPVKGIALNARGLTRVNLARAAKAQLPLVRPRVGNGDEALSAPATSGTLTAADMAALAQVDNSILEAFPPIRSQGAVGSCVSWATTYYQLTYETALLRGLNARNGDNAVILSPSWTYNQVNGGFDAGSNLSDSMNLIIAHGAPTWAEFPYTSNYRVWPTVSAIWRSAISRRAISYASISTGSGATFLTDIKAQLANGHVLTFCTYFNSWVIVGASDDPATTADDAFLGQATLQYMRNTRNGGHVMTIVGYDDTIWSDINRNGTVDPGEKGAFKVANSWGSGWGNGGFVWMSYDAMRPVTAVAPSAYWPPADRDTTGCMQGSNFVYTMTVRDSYTPTRVAEVTLNTAKRDQLYLSFGGGPVTAISPATIWRPFALSGKGGPYAFDGTTTPVSASFAFDLSSLDSSGTCRWFGQMQDALAGDPASLVSFRLLDGAGNQLAVCTGTSAGSALPQAADAATLTAWCDWARPFLPISVNFQPASAATMPGYLVDAGGLFSSKNDNMYGWLTAPGVAVDRNSSLSPDQRYDTMVPMFLTSTSGRQGKNKTPITTTTFQTWELAVPNGKYQVHVVAGDPSVTSGATYAISVEGVTVVNQTASSATPWADGTVTITVTDGRLTIRPLGNAVKPVINYVDIVALPVNNG